MSADRVFRCSWARGLVYSLLSATLTVPLVQRGDMDTVSDEFDVFSRASFDEVRSCPCPDSPRLSHAT